MKDNDYEDLVNMSLESLEEKLKESLDPFEYKKYKKLSSRLKRMNKKEAFYLKTISIRKILRGFIAQVLSHFMAFAILSSFIMVKPLYLVLMLVAIALPSAIFNNRVLKLIKKRRDVYYFTGVDILLKLFIALVFYRVKLVNFNGNAIAVGFILIAYLLNLLINYLRVRRKIKIIIKRR